MCICTPTVMYTYPHECVHVPHANTTTIKSQQEGEQLEPARSHRCSQQNWKWMPDGPVQGPLPQFRSGCSCFPGTWHFSSVSCFIFQIFVNTYSRKEKSVSFLSMIPSFFFLRIKVQNGSMKFRLNLHYKWISDLFHNLGYPTSPLSHSKDYFYLKNS